MMQKLRRFFQADASPGCIARVSLSAAFTLIELLVVIAIHSDPGRVVIARTLQIQTKRTGNRVRQQLASDGHRHPIVRG